MSTKCIHLVWHGDSIECNKFCDFNRHTTSACIWSHRGFQTPISACDMRHNLRAHTHTDIHNRIKKKSNHPFACECSHPFSGANDLSRCIFGVDQTGTSRLNRVCWTFSCKINAPKYASWGHS